VPLAARLRRHLARKLSEVALAAQKRRGVGPGAEVPAHRVPKVSQRIYQRVVNATLDCKPD